MSNKRVNRGQVKLSKSSIFLFSSSPSFSYALRIFYFSFELRNLETVDGRGKRKKHRTRSGNQVANYMIRSNDLVQSINSVQEREREK